MFSKHWRHPADERNYTGNRGVLILHTRCAPQGTSGTSGTQDFLPFLFCRDQTASSERIATSYGAGMKLAWLVLVLVRVTTSRTCRFNDQSFYSAVSSSFRPITVSLKSHWSHVRTSFVVKLLRPGILSHARYFSMHIGKLGKVLRKGNTLDEVCRMQTPSHPLTIFSLRTTPGLLPPFAPSRKQTQPDDDSSA